MKELEIVKSTANRSIVAFAVILLCPHSIQFIAHEESLFDELWALHFNDSVMQESIVLFISFVLRLLFGIWGEA